MWYEAETDKEAKDEYANTAHVHTEDIGSKKRKREGEVSTESTPNKKLRMDPTKSLADTPITEGVHKYRVGLVNLRAWLLSLPKYLWELGTSNPTSSKVFFFLGLFFFRVLCGWYRLLTNPVGYY